MRKTLKKKVKFEGIGLHSGQKNEIIIHPSASNEGIKFLINNIKIPATINYKINSQRGTILSKKSQQIETVEHLLSALYVLNVDDCIIEFIKGNEVPVYDGSSFPFFKKIRDIGFLTKNGKKDTLKINHKIKYINKEVEISATPFKKYKITFLFGGSKFNIEHQKETVVINTNTFKEISKARTFGFWSEIEYLKEKNLAKGANLDNVLIIKGGSPYKTDYRVKNELVKHKIIDFIGDFALLGKRIKGDFVIKRSGHYHNGLFMKKIMEENNG